MKNGEIYCRRYVNNIIIIFEQNKINELITNYNNNIHKCLEFKLIEEETTT
jgi:hypothetical protein